MSSGRRWLLSFLLAITGLGAAETPVTRTEWQGFERLDFVVADRPCLLIRPKTPAEKRPWIWRTEFFGVWPEADLALLKRGWHVAYMNAKNMHGSPRAIALFDRFYEHVVKGHKLAPKAVLEGFSRGGLYAFNFAVAYPERVAALYLDAPLLDIRSLRSDLRQPYLASYGLTDATVADWKGGPLDNIQPLVRARIPILSVCGDADLIVPLSENTAILERRYRDAGGLIHVILKPGVGHHPHSLEDPAPIVDFLVEHAKTK